MANRSDEHLSSRQQPVAAPGLAQARALRPPAAVGALRPQLKRYAQALDEEKHASLDLYFLLMSGWRDWQNGINGYRPAIALPEDDSIRQNPPAFVQCEG